MIYYPHVRPAGDHINSL